MKVLKTFRNLYIIILLLFILLVFLPTYLIFVNPCTKKFLQLVKNISEVSKGFYKSIIHLIRQ